MVQSDTIDDVGNHDEITKFFHSVQARDGGDPPVVIQLLRDQPFLSGRNFVEIRGNITKSAPPSLVILPKKRALFLSPRVILEEAWKRAISLS
jgi:hypothetical protein